MSTTPTGPPAIEPTSIFDGLRVKAIIVGVIVDHAATLVAFSALLVFLAARSAIELTEDIPEEVLDEIFSSPEGLMLGFVLGSLCTVLGGYVGARLAGAHFLRHGAFVGGASLLLGLIGLLFLARDSSDPLWYDVLSLVAIVPLGALGGWLEERRVSGRGA